MTQNEILKELIEQGRETGYLTYEDIHRYIPDSNINNEDLDSLYGTLQELGIPVIKKSAVMPSLLKSPLAMRLGTAPLRRLTVTPAVKVPSPCPPVAVPAASVSPSRMLTESALGPPLAVARSVTPSLLKSQLLQQGRRGR